MSNAIIILKYIARTQRVHTTYSHLHLPPTLLRQLFLYSLPLQDGFVYKPQPDDPHTHAVLAIVPPKDYDGDLITVECVFTAFAKAAAYADCADVLPDSGIKPYGKVGPFDVHTNFRSAMQIWSDNKGVLELLKGSTQIPCQLFVKKLAKSPTLGRSFPREYLMAHSLHVMIVLREPWDFRYIWPTSVREFWEEHNFLVFSCTRPNQKYQGQDLGMPGVGAVIHANVRSIDPLLPLNQTKWPPFMVLRVNPHDKVYHHPLNYQITENDAISGKLCLNPVACHGYFKPAPGFNPCICPSDVTVKPFTSRKQKRLALETAQAPLRNLKGNLPCRHWLKGTCNIPKCKFLHDYDTHDVHAIECRLMKDDKKKLCEAGRGCPYKHPWAQVAASSSLPPASEPGAVEAGADMEACKYTPYYLIKDRRATFYPSKKMRSKVWHVITTFTYHYVLHPRHIWDSTLGYPGEGTFPYPYSYHYTIHPKQIWNPTLGYPGEGTPLPYSYHYTIHPKQIWNPTLGYPGEGHTSFPPTKVATYNARGLRRGDKLNLLLKSAASQGIHILLIQEHNLTPKHRVFVEAVSKRRGFAPFVAYKTVNTSVVGGAAIFIAEDNPAIDMSDPAPIYSMQGGAAVMHITLHGHRTKIGSFYVPVRPPLRKHYIERITERGLLTSDMIAGGDWNTVPDITVDTQVESGTSSYANFHGPLLESSLLGKGLTDVFRLVNGKQRSYTHSSPTVLTRLDRIYAKSYNSHWRWTSATHDPSIFLGDISSDHTPVVAVLETAPARAPSLHEAKIDPNVYQSDTVRQRVRKAWQETYTPLVEAGYSKASAWEQAKGTASALLLEASADRRRLTNNKRKVMAALLKAHVATPHGSSPARYHKIKTNLELQLKSKEDPKPKEGWWAYICSLGEEVSSKRFYALFKPRFSNQDISSLHITDDWNDPDTRSGVATAPEAIVNELSKYYSYLFRSKPSVNPEPLLQKLRSRTISPKSSRNIDSDIMEKEVRLAIRSMAKGKAPGPDLLASEFYITFEDLIAPALTDVLTEAHYFHNLPTSTKQGVVKVLYKKKDTRDIRNYRPLTMLNSDYKVLTKILAKRVASVLDEIVSEQQLGFVPGRVITEASHLVRLVQAYLDETDEEGLLVALDWEKAFDSVSWDYLHLAIDALGFGPYMKRWYHILYNPYDPQERIVQANGINSSPFHLGSGIPQGCPLSPVTFLLISEALTRLINDDPQYEGIPIGRHTFRLTQFADDTLLLLRSYSSLTRAWELIDMYASATAMQVNVKKTEGIRCGKLKRQPHVIKQEYKSNLIKWVKDGEWVRLLGIPFWEKYDENQFHESLYYKAKGKLACWKNHIYVTQLGRAQLANTMYLSRFRYWGLCMVTPDTIVEATVADTQALIWSKHVEFDPDELGTDCQFRRWMKSTAQYGSRTLDLGLSVMDWKSHLKALRCKSILNYINAKQGDYKKVLDCWFARLAEGRSAVLCADPTSLTKAINSGSRSHLPRFWKRALLDIRSLKLQRYDSNSPLTPNEAYAIPIWNNSLFTLPNRFFTESWRNALKMVRLGDLIIRQDKRPKNTDDIITLIKDTFITWGNNIRFSGGGLIPISKLTTQWKGNLKRIPDNLIYLALGYPNHYPYLDSKIVMMLKSWAPSWNSGKGIPTRREPGRHDPVPHTSKPTRKQVIEERRSRFKGFMAYPNSNLTRPMYGTYDERKEEFHEHTLTTQGRLRPTKQYYSVKPHRIRNLVFSNGGVVGFADAIYPYPDKWSFEGVSVPISRTTVKHLTYAFSAPHRDLPTCMQAWPKRLQVNVNWQVVGRLYRVRLLTPRDFMSHYKNILHRALLTRTKINSPLASHKCRLCNRGKENFPHLITCTKISPLWDRYTKLTNLKFTNETDKLITLLLGVRENGAALPSAHSDLFLILWKFIIINFTLAELDKKPFDCESIWESAIIRYLSKANTLTYRIGLKKITADARQKKLDVRHENALLHPLGTIDETGRITWAEAFAAECPPCSEG